MKLKHNKYFSILIAFLFCSFFKETHGGVARKVAQKFAKNFAHPQKMAIFGYGGSMTYGKIQNYNIKFITVDTVDIDEAREKIIYLVENFLYFVNSSEAVQYLAQFPYDENKLNMGISFQKPCEFQFVDPPNIAYVMVCNGHVDFSIYDLTKKMLETVHLESYAEAYEKVMGIPFSERNLLDFRCTCRNETETK